MALKLDDFLSKKKEPAQVLDLSKATANSKEDFKRLLEKIPEYKIKPEKVKMEEIKIREKDFTFKTPKRELRPPKEYLFADPVPPEMRGVRLEDLSSVNIQWKMLTTLRPKNKLDEELFTRLVELGKLRLQTEEKDKRVNDSEFIRKMKNRAGVLETRVISCVECGEEFCGGETCGDFAYESYQRENKTAQSGPVSGQTKGQERGRSKKRKSRRIRSRLSPTKSANKSKERKKSKSRERGKSKSQERKKSKSPERRKSKSQERTKHKSAERKKSKSLERTKGKTSAKTKNKSEKKK